MIAADEPMKTEADASHPMETSAALREVAASLRGTVFLFIISGLVWLLMASALSMLAWLKMLAPGLLAGVGFLTYGRLWPAQQDALVYGWFGSVGIGIALGLMGRLCRTPLRHGGILLGAWALWNLGLTLGIAGILNGEGTSIQWLEFPRYSAVILFVGYTFAAIWGVLMFRYRREGHTYVSQWYLITAFLWFPWIYATANLVNFFLPIQPAAQQIVHWWFAGNFLNVWLASIGLAIVYYVIPKSTGRPIHRYASAAHAFWGWLFLTSWSGMVRLIGGPVPAWMITVSVVANTLAIIPLILIFNNLTGCFAGQEHALRRSPGLRFSSLAVYLFFAAGILGIVTGFRWLAEVTLYTQVTVAQETILLYGFMGLSVFGALYHLLPRLTGRRWLSPELIRAHFWVNLIGTALLVACLFCGGLLQGLGLEDAKVPPLAIINLLYPILLIAALGAAMIAAGNILFVTSFVLVFLGESRSLVLRTREAWESSAPVEPITAP